MPKFLRVVDELKFRVAYGEAGIAPGYGFNFNNAQNFYGTLVGEERGVVIGPNPNSNIYYQLNDTHLQPERSAEIETGFDAMLWQSRAPFSVTVYQKHVGNLVTLTSSPIAPAFAGTSSQWRSVHESGNRAVAGCMADQASDRPELARRADLHPQLQPSGRATQRAIPHRTGVWSILWYVLGSVGRSVSEIVNIYQGASDGTPVQVGMRSPRS